MRLPTLRCFCGRFLDGVGASSLTAVLACVTEAKIPLSPVPSYNISCATAPDVEGIQWYTDFYAEYTFEPAPLRCLVSRVAEPGTTAWCSAKKESVRGMILELRSSDEQRCLQQ